jgi:hypothetical protein
MHPQFRKMNPVIQYQSSHCNETHTVGGSSRGAIQFVDTNELFAMH